jgi:branched-chain amino acid aminotransferase
MESSTTPSINLERVEISRIDQVDFSNLPFGTVFSDHMVYVEYRNGCWQQPTIRPYGALALAPSISALQYGVSIFEGLKAHCSSSNDALLFRPWENARRLNRSARRLAMPDVPETLFLAGLSELVRQDRAWLPPSRSGALYIRPCYFSIENSIRVKPAEEFALVIFTCPVGKYFSAPLDVLATEKYVRAFPGGTGDVKPAGNYASALIADLEAREAGFNSVMWLDAMEGRYIEECGVMNIFFVIGNTVITPSLNGTILPGVTRDSVVTLLRDMGVEVVERRISIDEVVEAHSEGKLMECFGTGTAATIAHVRRMRFGDIEISLPVIEGRHVGPRVRDRLAGIMTGTEPDIHGWIQRI